METNKSNAGFITFEVLIVVGLMAVISIVLIEIFILHGRVFNITSSQTELQLETVFLGSEIGEQVRDASSILSSQTINSVPYTTDEDTLVLQIPSINSQGEVIPTVFDHTVIYLNGTNPNELHISTEANVASSRADTERVLSDLVNELDFRYNNTDLGLADYVTVEITLSQTFAGETRTSTFSERINLINK